MNAVNSSKDDEKTKTAKVSVIEAKIQQIESQISQKSSKTDQTSNVQQQSSKTIDSGSNIKKNNSTKYILDVYA